MNTKKMIDEIRALPVEERVMIVDSLLRSLNQPESGIDKKWIAVSRQRLLEMRSGTAGAAILGLVTISPSRFMPRDSACIFILTLARYWKSALAMMFGQKVLPRVVLYSTDITN